MQKEGSFQSRTVRSHQLLHQDEFIIKITLNIFLLPPLKCRISLLCINMFKAENLIVFFFYIFNIK